MNTRQKIDKYGQIALLWAMLGWMVWGMGSCTMQVFFPDPEKLAELDRQQFQDSIDRSIQKDKEGEKESLRRMNFEYQKCKKMGKCY